MEAMKVVLDANVLWSASVRDTLLTAAEKGVYQPTWSAAILAELTSGLKKKRPDLDPHRIDRTIQIMRSAFPDALVEGYEFLIPKMQNHVDDRHVLAAAVQAKAERIVTWNLAHFPRQSCQPYDILVNSPDDFLMGLLMSDRHGFMQVLAMQSASLSSPKRSVEQVIDTLHKSVPRFAEAARHIRVGAH